MNERQKDARCVLASFDPVVGWRVAGFDSFNPKISVVTHPRKLLRIPAVAAVRNGWFCNPRKLVFEWFFSKGI